MGFEGQILIEQTLNDDPVRTGHDIVAVGYNEESFRGFPIVTASVEYAGSGYRAIFGWIQTVTHEYAEPGDGTMTTLDAWSGLGAPVLALGFKPTFFDAPANPDHPDMQWIAHTFLVRVGLSERTLEALAGFSWGYVLQSHQPAALEMSRVSCSDWERVTSASRANLADWSLTCHLAGGR